MKQDLLAIDLGRLEVEWQNQPSLFSEYATKLAVLRADLRDAEHALKLTEAELGLEIRNHSEDYGLKKVTDEAIKACVYTQPDMKNATKKTIDLKYKVEVMQGFVGALEMRKTALENEVKLLGMDYFAPPKASGISREAIDDITKRAARGGKIGGGTK